jgi:hypothetical protein
MPRGHFRPPRERLYEAELRTANRAVAATSPRPRPRQWILRPVPTVVAHWQGRVRHGDRGSGGAERFTRAAARNPDPIDAVDGDLVAPPAPQMTVARLRLAQPRGMGQTSPDRTVQLSAARRRRRGRRAAIMGNSWGKPSRIERNPIAFRDSRPLRKPASEREIRNPATSCLQKAGGSSPLIRSQSPC